MFNNKESEKENSSNNQNNFDVFRPAKGSAKVIMGYGVTLKGEITNADEVQIEGKADVTLNTSNLIVGSQGDLKGNIESGNADIWGKIDGDIKISGTLTVQEKGTVTGTIEYQSLQIKLGGKVTGDIKASEKVTKISDAKNTSSQSLQDIVKKDKN